jgi:nucleotide-binding universal stress UspA family protein
MDRYRNLTVALARSGLDAGLIRYAAAVAALGRVRSLRFVHVRQGAADARPGEASMLSELKTTVAQNAPALPHDLEVTYQLLEGPLTDQLLTHVAQSETHLLFVGHRREHSGRRALARRLAMKAPCSVWMVPEDSPPRFGRLLVPVDFSEPAADSVRVATSLAATAGTAECQTLHVFFGDTVITYEGYDAVLKGEEREAYQRFIAAVDTRVVRVTPLFESSSHVADTILRVATRERADLIVLATRGRSRSSAILLGSTAEEVIIGAARPVLMVKHFGATLGVLEAILDMRFRKKGDVHTS